MWQQNRQENFTRGKCLKNLSNHINTMKRTGKYSRPIGFLAKNLPWLCYAYISYLSENNTWFSMKKKNHKKRVALNNPLYKQKHTSKRFIP